MAETVRDSALEVTFFFHLIQLRPRQESMWTLYFVPRLEIIRVVDRIDALYGIEQCPIGSLIAIAVFGVSVSAALIVLQGQGPHQNTKGAVRPSPVHWKSLSMRKIPRLDITVKPFACGSRLVNIRSASGGTTADNRSQGIGELERNAWPRSLRASTPPFSAS
jgi:hypothetical protein